VFEQRKTKLYRVPHRVRVLYLVKLYRVPHRVSRTVSCQIGNVCVSSRNCDVSYSSQTSRPSFEFRDAIIDFLSCG